MNDRANQPSPAAEAEAATHAPKRRPYVPPIIESGEAFERVQLASGCNEGVEDCEIPC